MIWVAIVLILGQGCIIGLLLYFVRTFGEYTNILLRTHESNVMLREATLKSIATMQELYYRKEGAA